MNLREGLLFQGGEALFRCGWLKIEACPIMNYIRHAMQPLWQCTTPFREGNVLGKGHIHAVSEGETAGDGRLLGLGDNEGTEYKQTGSGSTSEG